MRYRVEGLGASFCILVRRASVCVYSGFRGI